MKKNSAALIFLFTIIIIAASIGFANAKYQSSVTLTSSIDYAKTIGAISLYEPSEIEGYDVKNNSFHSGAYDAGFDNIRFAINNMRTVIKDGIEKSYTNEVFSNYLIRVVSGDANAELPVKYLIYELDSSEPDKNALPVDEQTGYYGPFELPVETMTSDFRFSMQIAWKETKDTLGIHKMKVQIVKKRADDSFKVIDETDLNLQVDVKIAYYALGSTTLLGSQLLSLEKGGTIDFSSAEIMSRLGIELPNDYYFSLTETESQESLHMISYATSGALGWNRYYEFEVTDAFADNAIEVYLVHNNKIPVNFTYRDRAQPQIENGNSISKIIASQILQIDKGTDIDFKNISSMTNLGITLPSDYVYIAAHFHAIAEAPGVAYYRDNYVIPSDTDLKETIVDVYVAPDEQRTVSTVLSYVDGTEKTIGTIQLNFNSDGTVTLDTEAVRKMDSLLAGFTSFEIGIKNTDTGATCQIGNPYNDVNVTVNYFRIYQYADSIQYQLGYCLANPKMCLYIKAWW